MLLGLKYVGVPSQGHSIEIAGICLLHSPKIGKILVGTSYPASLIRARFRREKFKLYSASIANRVPGFCFCYNQWVKYRRALFTRTSSMEETVPLSPTVPVSPSRMGFRLRRSHHRQWQIFTLLLVILTALTMSLTVFFAYNSSLPEPISRKLIFAKPERSILVLNLASQITIFCLAELTSSVMEVLRWALACTVPGVSAHTFLALGRSTNVVGVLFILFGRGAQANADSHRLWGSQRYITPSGND